MSTIEERMLLMEKNQQAILKLLQKNDNSHDAGAATGDDEAELQTGEEAQELEESLVEKRELVKARKLAKTIGLCHPLVLATPQVWEAANPTPQELLTALRREHSDAARPENRAIAEDLCLALSIWAAEPQSAKCPEILLDILFRLRTTGPQAEGAYAGLRGERGPAKYQRFLARATPTSTAQKFSKHQTTSFAPSTASFVDASVPKRSGVIPSDKFKTLSPAEKAEARAPERFSSVWGRRGFSRRFASACTALRAGNGIRRGNEKVKSKKGFKDKDKN